MTSLDLMGAFDPIARLLPTGHLPDLSWKTCGLTKEVFDSNQLLFRPMVVAEPLTDYDLVVIPGGWATRLLIEDEEFVEWIRTAAGSRLKTSVCSGALLLGAAGFLRGKPATTSTGAADLLGRYAAEVHSHRVVDAGNVVTGGGVSCAIDVGLYLCEKLAGVEARETIAAQISYPHYDPQAVMRCAP